MSDVRNFLFGRQAATHPIGYGLIDKYVDALPEAPAVFDHTKGFNGFHMLGNGPDPSLTVDGGKPKGDCAFVGLVNTAVVDDVETDTPVVIPTSNVVVSAYDTYDHGQDLGANLTQLLAFQYKIGLPWIKGAPYAALNYRDLDTFWSGVNAFGCGYIGIVVTQTMMNQTQAGEPWDLTGFATDDQVLGGHCVVTIARSAIGGEVATWGMRQAFTTRWLQHSLEEAHVILTDVQIAAKGDGYGLDLPHLEADLKSLAA
jgi:hypothetical protein